MVYLHFPSTLTPEELLLKDKYAILRKKKKALQDMKAPKPEAEKVNNMKRSVDPKDAKELAKKLIQSGKVSIPSKAPEKKTVFKRSRVLERRLTSTGRTEGHGGMTPGYSSSFHAEPHFEPFNPLTAEKEVDALEESKNATPQPKYSMGGPTADVALAPTDTKKLPKSYLAPPKDTFTDSDASAPKAQNRPKRGPTIYVGAQNLTEEILKAVFEEYGKIVNVKIHSQNVGFVTFETVEIAERAITEVNGSTRDDVAYDVQFARRQVSLTQLLNESSASASWTTIATSQTNKGGHDDKRKQVIYDEPVDDLFMAE